METTGEFLTRGSATPLVPRGSNPANPSDQEQESPIKATPKLTLRDFWYVAGYSHQITAKKPYSFKIFGEWLVAFRDEEGKPVVMRDACMHRRAQLSKGFIKDGCIVCPYHGWTYDKRGQVTHVPSEGPKCSVSKPKKIFNHVYPTLEFEDFVYVHLPADTVSSQNSVQPSPRLVPPFQIPNYKRKGYRTIRLINRFQNSVINCAENFVDIPHTVFVHPGIFRKVLNEEVTAEVTRKPGEVFVNYIGEKANLGWFSWFLNPSGKTIEHTDRFIMPNVTSVEYRMGKSRHFIITSQSVPVDEKETLVFTDLTYNYGIWNFLTGPFVRWQAKKIIDQDIEILGNQQETIDRYGSQFANSPADIIHVYIESIRNQLEQGKDPRELPEQRAKFKFWV